MVCVFYLPTELSLHQGKQNSNKKHRPSHKKQQQQEQQQNNNNSNNNTKWQLETQYTVQQGVAASEQ